MQREKASAKRDRESEGFKVMVVGYWLLVIGYWLMVNGYWLGVI